MAQERCPKNRKGERNAFCPLYRVCLDEAVRNSWAYWDCSECSHKASRDPKSETMSSLCGDPMQIHDLPFGMNDEI